MNLLWFILWLLACAHLFLSSMFVPPAFLWGVGMLMAAPIFLFLSLLPGPERKKIKVLSSLFDSLLCCGLIFLFQAASLPLASFISSRYHQISFLQPLVYCFLKICGLRIHLTNGSLFVHTLNNVAKISVTLERLGFFPFLLFLSGGMALLFLTGQRLRKIAQFSLALTGYCLFRFLILLLISIEIKSNAIFWSSIITSLSFLPLPFLLIELLPSPPGQRSFEKNFIRPRFLFSRESCVRGGLIFACFLFFIAAIGFHDPGLKKQGRILIDEYHSAWEWTDEEFDTKTYGKKTDYNFYCLSTYLSHFYSVEKNYQPITPHTLTETDIVMLKTPTQGYSDEEIEALVEFVACGGGLFLIGDHTNVFGMSTYLNKIAKRFNLRFRYDVTYDLPTYRLSLYQKPKLLPHPVVQYLPTFLFGSSCTLSIPINAASVMTGYGLRNHYLDYSQKNFFPLPEENFDYEFGLFVQSAALAYKKGRVLAFTDSTCFSNFFMFIPGKPELLLGSIEWLNRKNRFGVISLIFLLLGTAGFLYLLLTWRPKREYLLGTLLIFGLAAVITGMVMVQVANKKMYKYPKPKKDFFQLVMESEHSSLFLPVSRLAEPSDKSFHTFFVWSQRLGFVPRLASSLKSAMNQGKAVFLTDPIKGFTAEALSGLKSYLSQGGVVFLMDSPQNHLSTANQILQKFNMVIDNHKIIKGEVFDLSSTPVGQINQAGKIEGGIPLLADREGNAILSAQKYGAGMLAVFTASHLFQDTSMGYTNSIPNQYQHWLSELEFWILSSLAKKNFIPFSLYSSTK